MASTIEQRIMILEHPTLSETARLLAIRLADGPVVGTRSDLAGRFRKSEASVKRALSELRAVGWLEESRSGSLVTRAVELPDPPRGSPVTRSDAAPDPGSGSPMTRSTPHARVTSDPEAPGHPRPAGHPRPGHRVTHDPGLARARDPFPELINNPPLLNSSAVNGGADEGGEDFFSSPEAKKILGDGAGDEESSSVARGGDGKTPSVGAADDGPPELVQVTTVEDAFRRLRQRVHRWSLQHRAVPARDATQKLLEAAARLWKACDGDGPRCQAVLDEAFERWSSDGFVARVGNPGAHFASRLPQLLHELRADGGDRVEDDYDRLMREQLDAELAGDVPRYEAIGRQMADWRRRNGASE